MNSEKNIDKLFLNLWGKIFEENNFNNIEFDGFKYIFDNLK